MSDPIAELERLEREAWADDLELRHKAELDPELAELVAEADRRYLETNGRPWVNPLAADPARLVSRDNADHSRAV